MSNIQKDKGDCFIAFAEKIPEVSIPSPPTYLKQLFWCKCLQVIVSVWQ